MQRECLLRPDDASWWVRWHSIWKWSLKFYVLIWWDFLFYIIYGHSWGHWGINVSWLQTSGCSCSQAFLSPCIPAHLPLQTRHSVIMNESRPRPGGYITLFPKPWQLQVITKTLSVGHIPHDFILGVSLHMNETSGRWIQSWMCFHNHKEVLCCLSERVWAEARVSQNNN